MDRAVARLLPRHTTARVAVLPLERNPPSDVTAAGVATAPDIAALPQKTQERVGVLLLDREVAERSSLLPTLEIISGQTLLALERIRMSYKLVKYARERHFVALVENATDVILIVDDRNRIRYASPSARNLFDKSTIRGASLFDLVDESDQPGAKDLLRRVRSNRSGGSADWTVRKADGGHALTEVTCRDLRGEDSVRGVVVTLRDVSEQRRLEHELTRWAFHDTLTGLPNRRFFDDRVAQVVATERGITGAIVIDLDNFKLVNDGLGHEQGDTALRATADRLRETVGGDGFTATRRRRVRRPTPESARRGRREPSRGAHL